MTTFENANILYLEDDADSAELVKFMLNAAGMTVTVAESGEEALRLARTTNFDLFLLDGLLPSGYSFDLCPEFRKAAPTVPIVFYTALGFPAEVQQGADAGADAYLVKPFLGDLGETLWKIIHRARNRSYNNPQMLMDRFRSATP